MSSQGPVPLHAPLTGATLEEAMDNFSEAMHKAMNEMIEQVQKMQQEQAKAKQQEALRIVVPK